MKKLSADKLLEKLREGVVYRRAELSRLSKAIDRDLSRLVKSGALERPGAGLFYRPKLSEWGKLPASAESLVRAYLKTDDFLLSSPTNFNTLNVGLTQLYNLTTVYNKKRHGKVKLGGRFFDFKRVAAYPKKMTPEFLFVDLLNWSTELAEHPEDFEVRLKRQLRSFNKETIYRLTQKYGKERAKKHLNELLST